MALAAGTQAPDFSLVDTENEVHSLADHRGRKLVIAFFPATFSGVCDTEMCAFRDSLEELNDMDADVVGISVDPRFSNKEFATKHRLNFPILSDYKREAITAYDVVHDGFGGSRFRVFRFWDQVTRWAEAGNTVLVSETDAPDHAEMSLSSLHG